MKMEKRQRDPKERRSWGASEESEESGVRGGGWMGRAGVGEEGRGGLVSPPTKMFPPRESFQKP
jgi:hypothetical protein